MVIVLLKGDEAKLEALIFGAVSGMYIYVGLVATARWCKLNVKSTQRQRGFNLSGPKYLDLLQQ